MTVGQETQTQADNAADTQPLRIVHVARSPVGGVYRHVLDLSRGQQTAGHLVGLVTDPSYDGYQPPSRESNPFDLGLHPIRSLRTPGLGDLIGIAKVAWIILGLRPQILHLHGAKAGLYGRVAAGLIRKATFGKISVGTIYTPHGGVLHYPKKGMGRLYLGVEKLLEKSTHRVVFVSRYELNTYTGKIGRPRIQYDIVYNGLHSDEFTIARPISPAYNFTYLGLLSDLKGVDVFIGALSRLRVSGVDFKARIAGPAAPADRARYRQMLHQAELSDVVALDPSTNKDEVFSSTFCLVVPSRNEALPYVVLEAAAAGVPIVATHVGGIPEILRSRSHKLLPPADSDALFRQLEDVLNHPQKWRDEAVESREIVKQRFLIEKMTSESEAIYRGVLDDLRIHEIRH